MFCINVHYAVLGCGMCTRYLNQLPCKKLKYVFWGSRVDKCYISFYECTQYIYFNTCEVITSPSSFWFASVLLRVDPERSRFSDSRLWKQRALESIPHAENDSLCTHTARKMNFAIQLARQPVNNGLYFESDWSELNKLELEIQVNPTQWLWSLIYWSHWYTAMEKN